MSDQVFKAFPAVASSPSDLPIPNAAQWRIKSVSAVFDGSGAAGAFLPALQIIGPGGIVGPTFADPSVSVAAGGSAEVTFGPFLRGVLSSNARGAVSLVSSLTLLADGTFDATGIPATNHDLIIVLIARGTAAAATDIAFLRFNGDSAGGHYASWQMNGNGTSVSASKVQADSLIRIATVPAATATAGYFSITQLIIPGYASTTFNKNVNATSGYADPSAAAFDNGVYSGVWNSTAAINRIQIGCAATINFLAGSQARIYAQ